MKKYLTILLSLICLIGNLHAQIVNIPDNNFLTALRNSLVDSNNDGLIQSSEAKQVTVLSVNENSITNLAGIEAFVNLKSLNCSSNQLNSIDISQNKELEYLDCSFNVIETLDISQNVKLKYLDCVVNSIISLDLSQNTELTELDISFNKFDNINISKNIKLQKFKCANNNISTLDLKQNIDLQNLVCSYNYILGLDLTMNKSLVSIECESNQINILDLVQNKQLKSLMCQKNLLTSLNVSQNLLLETLICNSNTNLKTICVSNVESASNYTQFKKDPLAVWSDTCTIRTSIIEYENYPKNIFVYPNPNENIIFLGDNFISVSLFDIVGNQILYSQNQYLDLDTLPNGMYIVKVLYLGQRFLTQKIIKN